MRRQSILYHSRLVVSTSLASLVRYKDAPQVSPLLHLGNWQEPPQSHLDFPIAMLRPNCELCHSMCRCGSWWDNAQVSLPITALRRGVQV